MHLYYFLPDKPWQFRFGTENGSILLAFYFFSFEMQQQLYKVNIQDFTKLCKRDNTYKTQHKKYTREKLDLTP